MLCLLAPTRKKCDGTWMVLVDTKTLRAAVTRERHECAQLHLIDGIAPEKRQKLQEAWLADIDPMYDLE